jgi:hypothetical protein
MDTSTGLVILSLLVLVIFFLFGRRHSDGSHHVDNTSFYIDDAGDLHGVLDPKYKASVLQTIYNPLMVRPPIATYLSLPDKISDPYVMPPIPQYLAPADYANPTDYSYNAIDGSKPMNYTYNSKCDFGCDMNNENKLWYQRNMNRQPLIKSPAHQKISDWTMRTSFNDLNMSNHKVYAKPTYANLEYLPLINMPYEPGYLN